MPKKTKPNLEEAILKLIQSSNEINVHSVAETTGLSKSNETDRKAIQRALNSFVQKGILKPSGAARARVYLKTDSSKPTKKTESQLPSKEQEFKNISLSPEAQTVFGYVSRPIKSRKPVSYNQDFLRKYKPNKTFYLDKEQRERLSKLGSVEKKERPAGTYARNILDRLLINLSWNSSRLEGNTYSLLETKRLIEHGDVATGKDATETQMILNHKAAIEYIVDTTIEGDITAHEICSIHSLLSENLLGDPSASGRIREIAVGVKGSVYLPLDNKHLLQEFFDLFVEKLNEIEDPFEQSFFAVVHLSYLQAFEDVNKRTSRLVANIPLMKKNLKPLSFADVDQDEYVKALLGVYEQNDVSLIRDLYLWAYERSAQQYSAIQQSMGEPNLLKLKHRTAIHDIIKTIILKPVPGNQVVAEINVLVEGIKAPADEKEELFKIIETEIASLHDGNIARFKVRPSQFQTWKKLQ